MISLKRILLQCLLLYHVTAFTQVQGFFNIYEQTEKSLCASASIEIDDESLIVAAYDYYGGAGTLLKISKEGTIIKSVSLGDDIVYSGVEGLYRAPSNPGLFYGIGHVIHQDSQITKPFVLRFDDDLDLIEIKEVDLPGDYHSFVMSRSLLTNDGDFLYATSLNGQNSFHRLYMRIALDGELLSFYEESEECGSAIQIDAIFEFPEGNRFGDFRNSFVSPVNHSQKMRLFGFDDEFVFDTIHEYERIYQTIDDTIYSFILMSVANGTVVPFNDTTLLFSDRISEMWQQPNVGTIYGQDRSTVLFSADLEGNMVNYLVVGSGNDTVDCPVAFNAVDMAKDGSPDNYIYHGCYGFNSLSSPNHITLTKTDENLNVIWQKSYTHPLRFLQANCLQATKDGGCLFVGGAYDYINEHYDLFLLKVNSDGNVGIDEIVVTDKVAAFPNPGINILKLTTASKKGCVEVFDMNGRQVCCQQITEDVTTIKTDTWPAGIYIWKVVSDNSSSLTVTETGKWIKK